MAADPLDPLRFLWIFVANLCGYGCGKDGDVKKHIFKEFWIPADSSLASFLLLLFPSFLLSLTESKFRSLDCCSESEYVCAL